MKANLLSVYLVVLVFVRAGNRLETPINRAFTERKKAEEYARKSLKKEYMKIGKNYYNSDSAHDYYIQRIEVEIDGNNKAVLKLATDIVLDYSGKCVLKAMGGL